MISIRIQESGPGNQGPGIRSRRDYVSLTVQDPDGLGVQISGIARPGDSAYPQRS